MNIFLTGGNGLVGMEIQKLTDVIAPSHSELDITDRNSVFKAIKSSRPDCVIHCAAMTNVDRCETDRKNAWAINVLGTKNIADVCKETGAHLIFFSSDYIFNGKKSLYSENDMPGPINFYGTTKLEGEKLVSQLKRHTILRTSVIYGTGRQNFASWVLESLKNHMEIQIVSDQYNSPTLNTDIAAAACTMAKKGLCGIYHCSGPERINRYGFAIKIADVFGLDTYLIMEIQTESLKQAAKRPADSSLKIEKLSGTGIQMSDIGTGLKKLKANYFK